MRILVVNAGSSSLKLAVVEQPGDRILADVELARGSDASRHAGDDAELSASLESLGVEQVSAVGHRVVHGGPRHAPTLVDDAVLDDIDALDALAPLHNRVAAEAIRALARMLPDVPHVAVFDTAFHATLPEVARTYALPPEWVERLGIRRYGFHGLSVRWSVERAAALLARDVEDLQVVVAHLGSGASVTAVRDGASVATSMGMTPLEGLVMGTRSGSIDPGAIIALLRDGMTTDELADGISHRGGLLAVSGRTGDVRTLEAAAAQGDERARLALDLFAARAAAEIAAAATALARVDAVVFTGGIGTNAASVRDAICARLGTLGITHRSEPAGKGDRLLPTDGDVAVLAVRAREEVIIARDAAELVTPRPR